MFEKSAFLSVICVLKGDASTFSFACSIEASSMSIPSMAAVGNRCASMRAISPVPVPTSRQFRVESLGFRVESLGFRVEGLGFRVEGLEFRVES